MYRTVYLLEPNEQAASPIIRAFSVWGTHIVRLTGDILDEPVLGQILDPGLIVIGPNASETLDHLRWSEQWNLWPVLKLDHTSNPDCQSLHCDPNYRLPMSLLRANLGPAVQHCLTWEQECMRTGLRGELHVRFPSHSCHLERFLKQLMDSWLYPKFPKQEEAKKYYLAVKEMGINAIEWGNRKNPTLIVKLIYRLFRDRIEVRIRDHGPGFNPENLPHAAKSHDPLQHVEVREASGIRDGGFGIMMARAMVDELQFNTLGNEVMLRKNLATTA